MRFLLRVAACLLLVLAVSGVAALMWDRSDAAAAQQPVQDQR